MFGEELLSERIPSHHEYYEEMDAEVQELGYDLKSTDNNVSRSVGAIPVISNHTYRL